MNKLKLVKETIITLNQKEASQVQAGLIIKTLNRSLCGGVCTDSCVLTNKFVHCCF